MTKKKCTKRSLIFSVLAMLLCVSMLVGTTFAWFTDSVTSVKNKIVAGNLDVALYWSTDASTWAPVSGATNVFKEGTLWEPGHTEVVYLKVVNEGTLALKYQLGVNVFSETAGVNVAGDEFLLSNYIKFAALEDVDTAFADRAAAKAAAAAAAIPLTAGFAKASELETTNSAEYVALVVYMPETVGNEANYRGTAPQINLGINLVATQMTYEADSYDNQYDADANFSVWNGTVPAELPDTLTVDPATRTITVGDAAAFAYLHSLDEAWAGLYSASGTGANWTDYKDGKGADYYYHWEWDVVLASDIDLANQPWTPVDLSYFSAFDGKGYTVKNVNVTATANYAGLFSQVSAGISNLKVDGVVIDAAAYTHVGAVAGNSNGVISNVTVTDAIVTGNKYVGGIIGYGYASITSSTVADSVIAIPTGGQKEAGGLAGYLCAGDLATDTKDVNGNVVKDTVISAPTVASALVSQPNGLITIDFNTVANVTVSTEDDTADIFVSNNVGGKSIVVNNTESGCTVNKSATLDAVAFVNNSADLKTEIAAGATYVVVTDAVFTETVKLGSSVTATFINSSFSGNNSWGYVDNATYTGCTFDSGSANAAIHFDQLYGELVVENCTFTSGKIQIGNGGDATASFVNCIFGETDQTSIWSEKGIRTYCPTTFENCEFNNRVVLAGSADLALTFDGCTMNGGTPVYYVDNTDGIIRGGNIPTVTIK